MDIYQQSSKVKSIFNVRSSLEVIDVNVEEPTQSDAVVNGTTDLSPNNPAVLLPPCRVCGRKASGFHYGAITCEACQKFFQRSSSDRVSKYTCKKIGQCKILQGQRTNCSFCRYQKCLDAGMSIKAMKKGRYTHAMRTQNTLEAKGLVSVPPVGDAVGGDAVGGDAMGGDVTGFDVTVTNGTTPTYADEDDLLAHSPIAGELQQFDLAEVFQSTKLLSDIPDPEAIVDQLMETTKKYCAWERVGMFEKIKHILEEFYEHWKLKNRQFGDLTPVSEEEYRAIFNQTGIDVDGRRDKMAHYLTHLDMNIVKAAKFAKAIPGFNDIPLEDRIDLIKASFFEYSFLGTYPSMNEQLGVGLFCNGNTYHKSELIPLYGCVDYINENFRLATSLQKLELTRREVAILRGIIITFPDRVPLTSPEITEGVQLRMLALLERQLQKRDPENYKQLLWRIWDCVIGIRSLTEWNCKVVRTIMKAVPDVGDLPFVQEIYRCVADSQ